MRDRERKETIEEVIMDRVSTRDEEREGPKE